MCSALMETGHFSGGPELEWKPEKKLLELMVSHPGRYERDANGVWRCPPGEAAAERLGLSYRVRSSAELHPRTIRNLIFLDDYFFECTVAHVALMQILDIAETTPGIPLATLREQHAHLRVDDVYALIAPHPPRKSRPVRNVARWMGQETNWELVQKKE
jgi:putative transposase